MKLRHGVSAPDIVKQINHMFLRAEVRDLGRGDFEVTKNIHYVNALTTRHVREIAKPFKKPALHPDDAQAFRAYIRTKEEAGVNPIIHYKMKGETDKDTDAMSDGGEWTAADFICVYVSKDQKQMGGAFHKYLIADETHDTTAYGYHLLTIMDIDKCGRGTALGFAISSRKNAIAWKVCPKTR